MSSEQNDEFSALDDALKQAHPEIRKRGLHRLFIWLPVTATIYVVILWILPRIGLQIDSGGIVIAAIPGALALVGLMEAISGISYREWASRWDTMRGWQRGLLGTFLTMAFFLLLCVVISMIYS